MGLGTEERQSKARTRAKLYGSKIHNLRKAGYSWQRIGSELPIGKLRMTSAGVKHRGVSRETARALYARWQDLTGVLAAETNKHQEALRLRGEGLSSREVGEMLGVSPSTVRTWWQRYQ